MLLLKEEYVRKRICNGSSMQTKNSGTRVTVWQLVTEFSISTSQPLKILIFFTKFDETDDK